MKKLFKKWLGGEVNWEEEEQLRQLTKKDAFLADAMEGYDSFSESDHVAKINELKKGLNKTSKKEKGLVFYISRVAAAAAIVGIIGSFIWIQNNITKSTVLSDNVVKTTIPESPAFNGNENENKISKLESTPSPIEPIVKNTIPPVSKKQKVEIPIKKKEQEETPQEQLEDAIVLDYIESAAIPMEEERIVETAQPEKDIVEARHEGNEATKQQGNEGIIQNEELGQRQVERAMKQEETDVENKEEEIAVAENIVISASPTGGTRQRSAEASRSIKESSAIELHEVISSNPTKAPRPKGGFLKFEKYLKKNLVYPQTAKEQGIKKEIIIHFFINKKGRPTKFSTLEEDDFGFKKEAIRLLKKGPKWKPVNQEMNYTIIFVLKK